MHKTILLTGATDGIGLETAKMLAEQGHRVLLHGRNPDKLKNVASDLAQDYGAEKFETYVADLSRLSDVDALVTEVAERHGKLDVLINNAGVYGAPTAVTQDGLDIRFAVNTIAPYLLTKALLPLFGDKGRVVNLSSAAQAPVDLEALAGNVQLSDGAAYAQSKLAITMWTRTMAASLNGKGPMVVSVNPASLLGSKMVKSAFGVVGGDLRVGADILCRAALSDEFEDAAGKYFDNDIGRFGSPHSDALDDQKAQAVTAKIESVLAAMRS
ncbi:KR domain-containing protein [Photobacterium sanctipauli]|uniref:KR domain-containing protein n=1 Tax=Photobacterium sanctipauli TaxID=1342794 RepID=A0A2T3NWX6_9GAMM|nr:SDR family NAD(P)-dependent oxidoreductase [Photobacterium sanctipauli]PSW20784.1 KR domain-containing protein [Photobacterium sanctipauli]